MDDEQGYRDEVNFELVMKMTLEARRQGATGPLEEVFLAQATELLGLMRKLHSPAGLLPLEGDKAVALRSIGHGWLRFSRK